MGFEYCSWCGATKGEVHNVNIKGYWECICETCYKKLEDLKKELKLTENSLLKKNTKNNNKNDLIKVNVNKKQSENNQK